MTALSASGTGVKSSSGPGVKPKAITMNLRQRTQDWVTPLNLHYAGLAVVVLVNLYLVVQMALAWQQVRNQNAEALASQQVALTTAEIAARPLEGLDVKLAAASGTADIFYRDRLPLNYSQVAAQLGTLAKRQGIRLTRLQYAEAPVAGEGTAGAGQLTEVRMDASLSGDYKPLVLFLNSLERDRLFFYISGITLTGQQTGTVNLRIRLTTYIRSGAVDEQRAEAASPESALDRDLDAQAAKSARAEGAQP